MSAHDPILHAIWLRIQRVLLFFGIAAGAWMALWLYVLMDCYSVAVADLLAMTRAAWPPAANATTALLWWGACAIGVLTTAVLYLLVALWWKRSGDVHRRGTRFIDARDGRD
jgi:hypothetical protein